MTHDLANRLKLRKVTVGQDIYYSWIVYFSDLSHDAYKGTLKVLFLQYTAEPNLAVISGNGIESHFQELVDLFGQDALSSFKKDSQTRGTVDAIRLLVQQQPD